MWEVRMLPARSDSKAESHSNVHQKDKEKHNFCKRTIKRRVGWLEGKSWGGRRNMADRSQESSVQAPSWLCQHLEKAYFQRYLPSAHSTPASWEKPGGMGWLAGISGPSFYLPHLQTFKLGTWPRQKQGKKSKSLEPWGGMGWGWVGGFLSQGTVSSPCHLPPQSLWSYARPEAASYVTQLYKYTLTTISKTKNKSITKCLLRFQT